MVSEDVIAGDILIDTAECAGIHGTLLSVGDGEVDDDDKGKIGNDVLQFECIGPRSLDQRGRHDDQKPP